MAVRKRPQRTPSWVSFMLGSGVDWQTPGYWARWDRARKAYARRLKRMARRAYERTLVFDPGEPDYDVIAYNLGHAEDTLGGRLHRIWRRDRPTRRYG